MTTGLTTIAVQGVTKTFRLSADPVYSLKERMIRLGRSEHIEFTALHDANLEVAQGETVAILGHNGSGKSTLLKCIAGILTPTRGEVLVRGRLTSLLELGAGFHPELTGRENVYINAAFYGMTRRDITRRFDEIVEFAELHQFIDEPVKHYSSGMYVRLGFAVAVNLDPDVLLVDEVLAVGDEAFQAKCISRIKEFQADGRTIVFVTHDATTARQVCDRAIVIHQGHIVVDGSTNEAVRVFREHLRSSQRTAEAVDVGQHSGERNAIAGTRLQQSHEDGRRQLHTGEKIDFAVDIVTDVPIVKPVLAIELSDARGNVLFGADTDMLDRPLPTIDSRSTISISLGRLWLLDGEYSVALRLVDQANGAIVGWQERAATFEVSTDSKFHGSLAVDVAISAERD